MFNGMNSSFYGILDPYFALCMGHHLPALTLFCFLNNYFKFGLAELCELWMVCRAHDTTCCMYLDKVSTRSQHLTHLFRYFSHTITYASRSTWVTMERGINTGTHPLISMTSCCSQCVHTKLPPRSGNEAIFYSVVNPGICATSITYSRDTRM